MAQVLPPYLRRAGSRSLHPDQDKTALRRQVLKELNDALVKKLKEEKVIRSKKIRIDTTVVEANIHYPTDAGLLADGVKLLTSTVKKNLKMSSGI